MHLALAGTMALVSSYAAAQLGGLAALNYLTTYKPFGDTTTDSNNTATGLSSLLHNTNGDGNTAIGSTSMYSNTAGKWNNAVGGKSLYSITTDNGNTAG
jgi:hypothetical protein